MGERKGPMKRLKQRLKRYERACKWSFPVELSESMRERNENVIITTITHIIPKELPAERGVYTCLILADKVENKQK